MLCQFVVQADYFLLCCAEAAGEHLSRVRLPDSVETGLQLLELAAEFVDLIAEGCAEFGCRLLLLQPALGGLVLDVGLSQPDARQFIIQTGPNAAKLGDST